MKINEYKSREDAIEYLKWYFENDNGGADINAVNAFKYLTKSVKYKIQMDGKHCGNCNKWIQYNHIYCPYCGIKISNI